MTNSGKPPVVAKSSADSFVDNRRPATAVDKVAVCSASSGASGTSSTWCAVRTRLSHAVVSGSATRGSSRRVMATISGRSSPSRSRNDSHARVSSSHHCRLSSTTSRGRWRARNGRARPSKNRCRCQASTFARAPAAGGATPLVGVSSGTSRSTSRRQTGSTARAAARRSGLRSQSATGASASRADVSKQWVATTVARPLTCSASSSTRRLLPTPATPRTATTRGRESRTVDVQRAVGACNGAARPISGVATAPARCVGGPGRRRGPGRTPGGPISRSIARRVSGPGATPSSRSSTEAQWW